MVASMTIRWVDRARKGRAILHNRRYGFGYAETTREATDPRKPLYESGQGVFECIWKIIFRQTGPVQ